MRRPGPDLRDDAGVAMVMVMFVMLIAAGVVAAIAVGTQTNRSSASGRSDNFQGAVVTDRAVNAYLVALKTDVAVDSTDYALPGSAIHTVDSQSQAVSNAWIRAHDTVLRGLGLGTTQYSPGMATPNGTFDYSGRAPRDDGNWDYWQVYGTHSSETTSGRTNLVVYFRSWVSRLNPDGSGRAQSATAPHTVRVEFRPGRFSDYQFLTDGPITFGPGAVISGAVHYNGSTDPLLPTKPRTVDVLAGASCTAGASFSTSGYPVNVAAGTGCSSAPVPAPVLDAPPINVQRAEDAFDAIRKRCGTSGVVCPGPGGPWGINHVQYDVRISNGAVTLAGAGGWHVYGIPASGLTVLLDGSADVRGTTSTGRLTIAAATSNTRVNTAASASLYLRGAPGAHEVGATQSASAGVAVGLMAQGNIVPGLIQDPADPDSMCLSRVRASLVAESGMVGPPVRNQSVWVSAPGGMPSCPGGLDVIGSISAHTAPFLYASVAGAPGGHFGYAARHYSYDPGLLKTVPPFFPLTSQWQTGRYDDADETCMTTRWSDPTCA